MAPTPNYLMMIRGVTSRARLKYEMSVSSLPTGVASALNLAEIRIIVVVLLTGIWTHVVSVSVSVIL